MCIRPLRSPAFRIQSKTEQPDRLMQPNNNRNQPLNHRHRQIHTYCPNPSQRNHRRHQHTPIH